MILIVILLSVWLTTFWIVASKAAEACYDAFSGRMKKAFWLFLTFFTALSPLMLGEIRVM